MLRQVAAHQKRVQLFPARLLVVSFAPADHGKPGSFIEAKCRPVIFFDLEKYSSHAAACEMAEMGKQELSRQPPATTMLVDRDRENLGFIRADPRHGKAHGLPLDPQAMHQRVGFTQHALEFTFAPTGMKRGAVQLCQPW